MSAYSMIILPDCPVSFLLLNDLHSFTTRHRNFALVKHIKRKQNQNISSAYQSDLEKFKEETKIKEHKLRFKILQSSTNHC